MNEDQHSSPFEFNSILAADLCSVLGELYERQLLGALELAPGARPEGFIYLAPALTAKLIKLLSVLPFDVEGRQADLYFDHSFLSLYLYECSFLGLGEVLYIAKLSALAGFSEKYKNGSSLEFRADIFPKEEHQLYAISKDRLREIFKDYFPAL